jgi:hypothetical protein
MSEISKEVIKQTAGVITEVYKDVVSPSVQPIGAMVSYLPRTIRLAFSRWEKWIVNGEESLKLTGELLKEKISKIPEEKICEPEPYIAIPAIQQLSYCENSDVLRDLYANLLASSMNLDTKWSVHPSFVDIIKQLTPDEAKILKKLPPNIMINHPLIDVKVVPKANTERGGHTFISNFTTVGLDNIENKELICSYIENLERLKIIGIPPLKSLIDRSNYDKLKENQILKNNINTNLTTHYNIDYEYKIFNITNFGVSFVNTCCK